MEKGDDFLFGRRRKIYIGRVIEVEREGNTKGVTTGTRKFPKVMSVILIVTPMVKEIFCLCFPLWNVYYLLFICI